MSAPPDGFETSFEWGDDEPRFDGFADWFEALSNAATEDGLFEVLRSQRPPASKLARQQIRGRLITLLKGKADELDSSITPAKTADAWLHEGGDPDRLQGQTFDVEEIKPWASPVDAADVLDEVLALFAAYVHATDEKHIALALWTAYSHLFDCFGISPILDISSPTKRCGKSTAIVVGRHLCRASLLSSNISPAALFRAVEAWKPTLLIDEADTFATMNDDLRGILNAGHTRDTAFVVRAEGDSNEPRLFSTWAPKVVAAIGRLPDTIEDRSIRVVLTRKPVGVAKRDAFDPEAVRRDCEPVRRKLARFALDELEAVTTAKVVRPDGLHDRAWNNWRPLLAIASAAGPEWLARAEHAALVLSGDGNDDADEDVGTLALQHVWEILEPAGRLKTADVLQHMVSKDEGSWAKWWEPQLAKEELKSPAAHLARLLRPFGIKPKQVWIDGRNERGYDAEDFAADAITVYLEKDPRDARDARTGSSIDAGSSTPSTPSDFSGSPREDDSDDDFDAPRRIPIIGDDDYVDLLEDAHTNGDLTDKEAARRYGLHKAIAAELDGD